MTTLVVGVIAVLVFELLVWFGAADSTDGIDSAEWMRRKDWRRGV